MWVGRRLGAYDITAELGAGGMGTVYRAIDTRTSQLVAIKHLKPELAQPSLIERFQREGEALRRLNHPNIVKMIDSLSEDGHHFLVLEYVEGGDLKQALQHGALPVQRAVSIALDLADALTRAHRLDIIHRDLKPANILIAVDGTPRLSDFGVAHFGGQSSQTDTGQAIGTLDYLAPETLTGHPPNARTDIWAFGLILCQMLTGQHPFHLVDDPSSHIVTRLLYHPLPKFEALYPQLPIPLIDLMYRMLERDPQARIPSVRHIGAALEDILQHRHTPAPQPSTSRFATPSPDSSLQHNKHNLPPNLTPFIGRENERAELARLLRDSAHRLITVVAPGGMGKTRLAIQTAAEHVGEFTDGVYLVELAPLNQSDSIITTIADMLGYQFQNDGRNYQQQVLDVLSRKHLLLLLDNFEHLLDGASLVTSILQAAPRVTVLATSRQRLAQPAETVFHLTGMDFPAWETPEEALDYAAVKLFLSSARRAVPQFSLTADNLDSVARICRLTGGMPLAIVLAAAWLSMLNPDEIAAELQHSLDILSDEVGEMAERQRSIRAVFDYAWQTLSTDEQHCFVKLSIFRGGFSREAAHNIAGATLRDLMSFTHKSLLHRNSASGRYHIHELLRQYAEEKLRATDQLQPLQESHSAYYLTTLHARQSEMLNAKGLVFLNDIAQDLDNVTTALHWAASHGAYSQLGAALRSVWFYYTASGEFLLCTDVFKRLISSLEVQPVSEQRDQTILQCLLWGAHALLSLQDGITVAPWVDRAQALIKPDAPEEFHARLNYIYGMLLDSQNRYDDARTALNKALIYYQNIGEDYLAAHILIALGISHGWDEAPDSPRASDYFRQAHEVLQRHGNTVTIGTTSSLLGSILATMGDFETGERYIIAGQRLLEQAGNRLFAAITIGNLGVTYNQMGENLKAIDYYQRALALHRSDYPRYAAHTMINLVYTQYTIGDYASAVKTSYAACALIRGTSYIEYYQRALNALGESLSGLGDSTAAEQAYSEVVSLNQSGATHLDVYFEALHSLTHLALWQQDNTKALKFAEQAGQLADQLNDDDINQRLVLLRAWIAFYQADNGAVIAAVQSLASQQQTDAPSANYLIIEAMTLYSRSMTRSGKPDRALLPVSPFIVAINDIRLSVLTLWAFIDFLAAEGQTERAERLTALLADDTRVPKFERQLAHARLNRPDTHQTDITEQATAIGSWTLEQAVKDLLSEFSVT